MARTKPNGTDNDVHLISNDKQDDLIETMEQTGQAIKVEL